MSFESVAGPYTSRKGTSDFSRFPARRTRQLPWGQNGTGPRIMWRRNGEQVSGYEKTHRPERDYAERDAAVAPARTRGAAEDGRAAPGVIAGEAALWQQLDPVRGTGLASPVQRKHGGVVSSADPGALATSGVAAAADPLPHHEQIQASFGRHDVSHVRSQVGGSAAEAAHGLGASAYTIGDRVGFAAAPDLHTAAHEAAHTIQQQAGVQLKGGIDGGKGDPYERHADQVADAVVRGESAEALLEPFAAKGGGQVVQRKGGEASSLHGMVNARRYLQYNAYEARTAIFDHILAQRLPRPHPRMEWHDEKVFYEALFFALTGIFGHFELPFDFAQMLFPGDPYAVIDQMRPLTSAVEAPDSHDQLKGGPVGPWTWSPAIGLAIAQLVELALIASLYRLGPRWVTIAELAGSGDVLVDPSTITRSHPMDRYVVPAMCKLGAFELLPETTHKGKKHGKKPLPKIGLRDVTLTWVGKEHPELWNWVRASPADATAEEVSAKVFAYMGKQDHESHTDYYAAFLTAAPPMFGIPPQWAKTFDETKDFRPNRIPAADSDPDHQVAVLGGSSLADEQALAEIGAGHPERHAKPNPHASAEYDGLVADTSAQASFLKRELTGWGLGESADKALSFLTRRKHDSADAAKWVAVLRAERENLTKVATGLLQLDQAAAQMKLAKSGPEAKPLHEIVRFYADATATAHLNQTCNRMILRAANAQSALAVQALQSSARDMDTSADAMRAGVNANDYDRNKLSNVASHLDDEAVAMQTRLMRGEKVSGGELEDLQLRLEETSLETKFTAIDSSLQELESAADEAGDGIAAWFASRFSSRFRGLKDATQAIRDQISSIRFKWDSARNNADMPGDDGMDHTKEHLRAALETAKQEFNALQKKQDIHEFLQEGANLVKWQEFRTACVRVAALIGISLVGGVVGGMVARGAAGMMAGTSGAVAMENLSFGGMMVARGAGLVTETAVTSVGQSVVFGDKLGDAFLENMIMNLGTAGVMHVLAGKGEELARAEKAAEGVWGKSKALGKLAIKESAAISGHTIMGIAMGYVAHKIVTGQDQPPPETLQEWFLQGASIAVGRYVGHAMEASHAREAKLKLTSPEAVRLRTETERISELAKRVEQHPQAKDAMELLEQRHQHLTSELKLLDEIEKSPEEMKQAGLSKRELARSRAELKNQLADVHSQGFGDVPLHLAGLHELIPGALWSGTEHQIQEAVSTAHEAGIEIQATRDKQGGKWHLEVEGRHIEVEERFEQPKHETPPKPEQPHNRLHDETTVNARRDVAQAPKHTQADVDRRMEAGHASVEVHSHFMGNVPPEAFLRELELSGTRAKPGESRWEPMLHEIAKLNDTSLAHRFDQRPDGTKVPVQQDPHSGRAVVQTRGAAGDALTLVNETIVKIGELRAERNDVETSPARRVAIDHEIDALAKNAVEKSLRASDETDFNSSYEIRDELVKSFYGKHERDEMLAAKGMSSSDSIIKTAPVYREHFTGRPDVLQKIDRAVELQHQLDSDQITDPDPKVKAQKIKAAKAEISLVSEQISYDAYAKDTLLRLAQDDIRYTEQSNSAKKLAQRFDPGQIKFLKEELKREHPELADKIDALEVKHLAMISTNNFGAPDENVDISDAKRGRTSQQDFDKAVKQVVAQTARPDTVGVDIAGMEHYAFDKVAKARFKQLYDALLVEAKKPGHDRIVFRPHVGEGAADVEPGRHGARDSDRQVAGGELTHYKRARENIDAMLDTLEQIADEHKAECHGRLPPEVIVRFGHATHTTPEQAARMAKLGVIAEVNLQSNVETGAVDQSGHNIQGGDRARGKGDTLPAHEVNPSRRPANLDDHALGTLVFNNVEIILSTDAHEVMSTDLKNEYTKAKSIIDAIIQNRRGVRITGEQASEMRSHGATVADPGRAKEVVVFFDEMSSQKQQVFRDAYRKLYDDALAYFDQRPKADKQAAEGAH